jgi:hypothetical protein
VPLALVVAVIVKLFATRDSACVGVHESVLPEMVAPVGPVVSAKVTVLPSVVVDVIS